MWAGYFKLYLDEQFEYFYVDFLKQERLAQTEESLKKVYIKHFGKMKLITTAVDKMSKRCLKHFSKETSDEILPICRDSLNENLKARVFQAIGSLPDK